MKVDGEVVLAAVKQCGTALEYAALELQANFHTVIVAASNHGGARALKHASARLRNDPMIAGTGRRKWLWDENSRVVCTMF